MLNVSVGAVTGLLSGNTPHEDTLRRMEKGVAEVGEEPENVSETKPEQRSYVTPPELEQRLDRIDAQHPVDTTLRMLERENLSAVYRAAAIAMEAHAAEMRAAALRDAERASGLRAETLRDAEQHAGERRRAIVPPASAFIPVPRPGDQRTSRRAGGAAG